MANPKTPSETATRKKPGPKPGSRRTPAAAETAPPAPPDANVLPGPERRHQYDIPPELRAAAELTPEERAQQEAHARADAATADARIRGEGAGFSVEMGDRAEPLGFLEAAPPQSEQAPRPRPELPSTGPTEGFQMMDAANPPINDQPAALMWAQTNRPRGFGQRPERMDAPVPAEDHNVLAQQLGSRSWHYGYADLDWCRDLATGERHRFSIWFDDLAIAVDYYEPTVFAEREAEVRVEVAEKVAAIRKHNQTAAVTVGYLACVRGYTAQQAELDDLRRGYVCTELRLPLPDGGVRPVNVARERALSGSGDPVAQAEERGERFAGRQLNSARLRVV